MARHIIFVI